jgi:hypothetical protein
MRIWAAEANRGVRGLLILAIILVAGRAFAQNGPVLMPRQPASEEVQARAVPGLLDTSTYEGGSSEAFPGGAGGRD